jgi:mannitol/fructose-specific phosphotransferase system IIA component (Ntr-type)
MDLLGKIAGVFLDKNQVATLETASTPQQIADTFGKVNN